MTDTVSRAERSRIMSRIRSRGTLPELGVRSALQVLGIPFVEQTRVCGVSADFLLPGRVVLLVHGCFWHGCPEHYHEPKSRRAYWRDHIGSNVRRDRRQARLLRSRGYSVSVVWEHALRRAALQPLRRRLVRTHARARARRAALRTGVTYMDGHGLQGRRRA